MATAQTRKGKWNFIGYNEFRCISCGSIYTQDQLTNMQPMNQAQMEDYFPKFCPQCGNENN